MPLTCQAGSRLIDRGAGRADPEMLHSPGRGMMSSLWGSHGAFLAPEAAGEQGMEAGGDQQNLLGHSHPAAGWCSAVPDAWGQDWCQTRAWPQCSALGTAFQQFQVKLPLHFHEGNAMSWAMLSHSHQNPSITLPTPCLDHPQGTKPRADIALQKENTALLDQKIQKAELGAELHLAMGTMAMPMSEPGARVEHNYKPSSLQTFFPAPPLPVPALPCCADCSTAGKLRTRRRQTQQQPMGFCRSPQHSGDPQPVQDCPSHLRGWEENESSRSQQGILIL